ncbi:type II toxin-antitoxin system RelE/ParE family toxin [Providencia rustigianii]|uniref:Toxin-antitoxin system, toxin component, RelE family n=2 Tax=Providencia rustigianii TaxID=158850 RepID=D1NZL3_9GAMM|nr:type II toxin-antitoxin system RelE/ParE family toxin [Providencia rustigianii]EFB73279.1 toxin-antitoxin system, toxin component, RelE family [Providencia rustigianii DSM 4541]SUC26543.1 Uncharacterized protein conserved in bacteria [Providencia rustigianii]SUC35135.1 Uncharacterized protein conserved in bacteria [Providencia rustigianii]
MAIYKTKIFKSKLKKLELDEIDVLLAAKQVLSGCYEADLGGGVIKKRLAIQGFGKRAGIRTIIFYKQGSHLFFADGWSKSRLASKGRKEIEDDDLESYKDIARILLNSDPMKIAHMLKTGYLIEVENV